MHWASTKLKLNFYLINLYVAFTWRKNTHFRILILEYDEANAPLQIKRSRFKKKAFQALILIRKPKESPRRGIEPRSPA